MTIRWLLAAFHLLALGVGLGAVWARGRALQAHLDVPGLRRVFYADTWWGIAALAWIGTGLVRAFGGYEKGSFYFSTTTCSGRRWACWRRFSFSSSAR